MDSKSWLAHLRDRQSFSYHPFNKCLPNTDYMASPTFLEVKQWTKIGKNSASLDHILGEREASNKIYFKKNENIQ